MALATAAVTPPSPSSASPPALILPPGVAWAPNPGGQTDFLRCPAFQVLAHGNRGGGKTKVLLADFARDVGRYGAAWWGVLFRRTYDQLTQVVRHAEELFYSIWREGVDVTFTKSPAPEFHWATGERLLLRYAARPADYSNQLGWEVPWIGFEELPEWPSPDCYDDLIVTCRTTVPGLPIRVRANANPYGRGKNWVKRRFIDPSPGEGLIFFSGDGGSDGLSTCHIQILREENVAIMAADPGYENRIRQATLGNVAKAAAWLRGDWTKDGGGLLDDLWDDAVHVVEPFDIPASWRIDRSYDYGSGKPWACVWWAESDGTTARCNGSELTWPRGTLFAIAEAYGLGGDDNQGDHKVASAQAAEIRRRQDNFSWGDRVRPGPADRSIFHPGRVTLRTIADEFADFGIRWEKAENTANTRVSSAELVRTRLAAATEDNGNGARLPRWPMEEPGLFVFSTCRHVLRTVPIIPRDERNPDDADTEAEDHLYDCLRYRLLAGSQTTRRLQVAIG